MTAKSSGPQKISVKTDDDLSPEDIQAKIDAQASNVGAKKESKAVNINVSSGESKEAKPKAEKPKTEESKVEKPKISAAKRTAPTSAKTTEPAVVSHRGKILNPADARKDEAVDGTDNADEAKPEPKVEPTPAPKPEPEPVKEEVDEPKEAPAEKRPEIKPAEQVSEKLTEISDDLKEGDPEKEAEKAKKEENSETQQPQIFDTKEYHLPIKATKHHKKNSFSATDALLFLLIVLFAAYIAADLDIYDPGFKLPFDFL